MILHPADLDQVSIQSADDPSEVLEESFSELPAERGLPILRTEYDMICQLGEGSYDRLRSPLSRLNEYDRTGLAAEAAAPTAICERRSRGQEGEAEARTRTLWTPPSPRKRRSQSHAVVILSKRGNKSERQRRQRLSLQTRRRPIPRQSRPTKKQSSQPAEGYYP